jgi:lipopolysaccharide export system protein LptA
VEIRSTRHQFHTNFGVFEGQVVVQQYQGDQLQGTLKCGLLTVYFQGTNVLREIRAEQGVIIEHGVNRFESAEAIYTGSNSVLELAGSPKWFSGDRFGSGRSIIVDSTQRAMLVSGNARMHLPTGSLNSTNLPLAAGAAVATNAVAEITSEQYTLSPETAFFIGSVSLLHPQMYLGCERLTVEIPQRGQRLENIMAEEKVHFHFKNAQNLPLTGRGGKAVYSYTVTPTGTNDIIELTGDPVLESTSGVFRNEVIVLDIGKGKLVAPGTYKMRGQVPGANTNMFGLPRNLRPR